MNLNSKAHHLTKYIKSYMNDTLTQVIRVAISKELLLQHLRDPLYKNAYYLTANTAIAALLGFVFWIIVARFYSPTEVGLASALIATIGLLVTLSRLGMGIGLIRFLPTAGKRSTQMINTCLTIGTLASIVMGAIFVAGLQIWSPALVFIREHSIYVASFLLFIVVYALSALLDTVFIAKRAAKFTFVKNVIAGVLKVPLPIVFAAFFGAFGIFASAGLAMAVGLSIALLWLLPKVEKGYFPFPTFHKEVLNNLFRYSLGNHIALLLSTSPILLYPLIVINTLGAEPNAYFYIAWAIASLLFTISGSFSTSLLAEGSYQEELLLVNTKRSLKVTLLILLPAIVVLFAFGDTLLLLFGKAYSQNATTLLWVLALSAIPLSINRHYLTVIKVRKEIKRLIIVSFITACLSLGLSYLLMVRIGLLGVGVGWIAGQGLVATTITLYFLKQGYFTRRLESG